MWGRITRGHTETCLPAAIAGVLWPELYLNLFTNFITITIGQVTGKRAAHVWSVIVTSWLIDLPVRISKTIIRTLGPTMFHILKRQEKAKMPSTSETSSPLAKPLSAIAVPGMYLFYKYSEFKRQQQEIHRKKVTEKELDHLNHKIVSLSCV